MSILERFVRCQNAILLYKENAIIQEILLCNIITFRYFLIVIEINDLKRIPPAGNILNAIPFVWRYVISLTIASLTLLDQTTNVINDISPSDIKCITIK